MSMCQGESFSQLLAFCTKLAFLISFNIHPGCENVTPRAYKYCVYLFSILPLKSWYWCGRSNAVKSDKDIEEAPDYGDKAQFFETTVVGDKKVGVRIRNLTKVFKMFASFASFAWSHSDEFLYGNAVLARRLYHSIEDANNQNNVQALKDDVSCLHPGLGNRFH